MHAAYQQRLQKEHRTKRVAAKAYYGKRGEVICAPKVEKQFTPEEAANFRFSKLYGSASHPALGHAAQNSERLSTGRSGSNSGRRRPLGAAAMDLQRQSTAGSGRSDELVFVDDNRRRSVPATPSCRTASSRLTEGSALWKEVEAVVQEEVLRAVRPLQEQIESEAAAREVAAKKLEQYGVRAPPGVNTK